MHNFLSPAHNNSVSSLISACLLAWVHMCVYVPVYVHAVSVHVPMCIYLWAVLERYCPAVGSALHYSRARASQRTLKGNLNKGKEKNKTAKSRSCPLNAVKWGNFPAYKQKKTRSHVNLHCHL